MKVWSAQDAKARFSELLDTRDFQGFGVELLNPFQSTQPRGGGSRWP